MLKNSSSTREKPGGMRTPRGGRNQHVAPSTAINAAEDDRGKKTQVEMARQHWRNLLSAPPRLHEKMRANYFRSRLTLLRTAFRYGVMPAARTLVIARCAWVELGACPPSRDAKNIDCQDVVALTAMPASDAADATTFSSTMRFISRSCLAEGRFAAPAIAAVRFVMTVAEPCINSMEPSARSNQAPTSELRARFMGRHQAGGRHGGKSGEIRPTR